jgi:CHAT domain-containing protein
MERFYENLWKKNLGKLAALRDAQLWMLRVRGARGLQVDARGLKVGGVKRLDDRLAPYYWAAFVLSGDWR